MIDSFITSFKLKNTYRVNSIIYSLKQLPLVRKLLPNSLYKSKGLKIFGNIVSTFIELGTIFIGKLLYIMFMIFPFVSLYKTDSANTFLHLFFFLTLTGGLFNTFMFNPTKDKYYALILMNMDAKKFTLSNYYYALIKQYIGFMPFVILFGLNAHIPFSVCTLLPVFVFMVKLIVSNYCLNDFLKSGRAKNENLPSKLVWGGGFVLLLLAYGLPFAGIVINQTIFLILFIISVILGIYSLIKINEFPSYKQMYKQILTRSNVYFIQSQNSTDTLKDTVAKQIEYSEDFTSNKKGFAYFHELFVKRHRKILTGTAKKQTIVILAIFAIVITALCFIPDFKGPINEVMLLSLPYFVFIMYLINRGTAYTQALFMNCDHSMLSFRIFRTPRVILGLFKERLKTLIIINMIPAIVIAIGLPLLLFISGGTDNVLNYAVLFFSIVSMSIFFSVHNLVMYYILQPYNISTELKSSTYKVVQAVTYIVCYWMIDLQLPSLYFGGAMILFSVTYSLVSLYISYKYAPNTFKLRI